MDLISLIEEFFNKAKNLNVAVIGETIIDEFVTVDYEGMSMKSSCAVLKLNGKREFQKGGAAIIANHLKDFVGNIDLFTNSNNEIIKTRYIDSFNNKKYIEINKFEVNNFPEVKIDTTKYDVVIVADFGHGYCDKLEINDGFYLMCQTNSNNFGFNRVSKWKSHKKKGVCIDKREASLQVNRKLNFSNKEDVFDLFNYEMNCENLFITLGVDGAIHTDGNKISKHPIFKSKIVDTIGAGDTFFAFACIASQISDKENVLIIPSLAASLSTTWICNAEMVTKQKLLSYANQYL